MLDATEAMNAVINMQLDEFLPRHPNTGKTAEPRRQITRSGKFCHPAATSVYVTCHFLCPGLHLTSEVQVGSVDKHIGENTCPGGVLSIFVVS